MKPKRRGRGTKAKKYGYFKVGEHSTECVKLVILTR